MAGFIKEMFGLDAQIEQIPAPPGLPIYMTANRTFSKVVVNDTAFLMVTLPDEDRFGAVALEKQLLKYMDAANMNVAYAFPAMTKAQRDSLVSRRLPFVCVPEQIYLPFLGIALSDHFKQVRKAAADHFTPAAQCLFLYLLYQAHRRPVLKKDAAEALGLTRTSITRASGQLKELHLITEEANGTELRMIACEEGAAYLKLAEPYLIDPVARTITVRAECISERIYAGETALGMRSMMNEPVIQSVALDKKRKDAKTLTEVDEKWVTDFELLRVELWKYDPALFARDGIVDPVSMAASLRDCTDERVQGELEDYMRGYQW